MTRPGVRQGASQEQWQSLGLLLVDLENGTFSVLPPSEQLPELAQSISHKANKEQLRDPKAMPEFYYQK